MYLVRFDPSIVTVKQLFIVSQIVSSPVVLSPLDFVNRDLQRQVFMENRKPQTANHKMSRDHGLAVYSTVQ